MALVSSMTGQHIWRLPYPDQGETANTGPIYSTTTTTTAEQKAQMQQNSSRIRDPSLAKTQRIAQ